MTYEGDTLTIKIDLSKELLTCVIRVLTYIPNYTMQRSPAWRDWIGKLKNQSSDDNNIEGTGAVNSRHKRHLYVSRFAGS